MCDDLCDDLDIGGGRCRDRISRLVSFKGKIPGERPETLPLPADNSARSRAGTGAEAEIEEATLGLDKRMTLRWLRAALIPSFDEEEPIEQVTVL